MNRKRSSKEKRRLGFMIFFIACLVPMLFPPIINSLNRAEPFILGMPFILFVCLIYCILVSGGLAVLAAIEFKKGELL